MSNRQKTALVVDEKETVRQGIAGILRGDGYSVTSCATVDDALHWLEEYGLPTVLVTDDFDGRRETGLALIRACERQRTGLVMYADYNAPGDYRAAAEQLEPQGIQVVKKSHGDDSDVLLAAVKTAEKKAALERVSRPPRAGEGAGRS